MTKLSFKEGVSLKGVVPQLVIGIMVLRELYAQNYVPELVITSVNDGEHMEGSYHYEGRAFDARTRGSGRSKQVAASAREILGPLGFDVVLEDETGPNEHLHVELDRRAGY